MVTSTTDDGTVYAIVEQMGHRRFGARVRDVTRFGAACMEATVLLPSGEALTYVYPSSLFAVTVCTEAQARAANAYGGTGLPALDAGGGSASERDDNERDDNDCDDGLLGVGDDVPCHLCGAPPGEPCRPGCQVIAYRPAHEEG